MLAHAQESERRSELTKERRDAYVAALLVIELDLRRMRYKLSGKAEKLDEIDRYWSKGRRAEMTMEAIVAVSTFGSAQAQQFANQWRTAVESGDETALQAAAHRIQQQVRHELNPIET